MEDTMKNKSLLMLVLSLILALVMSTSSFAATGPLGPDQTPMPTPNPFAGFNYGEISSDGIGQLWYGKTDYDNMIPEASYQVTNGTRFGTAYGAAYENMPKDAQVVTTTLWVPSDKTNFMSEQYRFMTANVALANNEKTDRFFVISPTYSRATGYSWDNIYVDIEGSNMLLKSFDKKQMNWSNGCLIQLSFYVW